MILIERAGLQGGREGTMYAGRTWPGSATWHQLRPATILDPIPGEKLVLSMYSAYRPSSDAARAIHRYATRPLKPSTPLGTSPEASS